MPEFSCSHYYTYAEITELLEGWVEEYGDVCELSSIGTSLEGRELWLLTGARPSPARPPTPVAPALDLWHARASPLKNGAGHCAT